MLKQVQFHSTGQTAIQPPSGGCVLKPDRTRKTAAHQPQPPSGGCVLKRAKATVNLIWKHQPPSGGCVLKLCPIAAGFRLDCQPPSGGCVLKLRLGCLKLMVVLPAAFGRLCVETLGVINLSFFGKSSRLRAAVC